MRMSGAAAASSSSSPPSSRSDTPAVEILQSWGVASARHVSGFPVYHGTATTSTSDEFLYDVPMGSSIIRWDLGNGKRLLQFQAHSDVVSCSRISPARDLIASTSFSGEVKLWDPHQQWACLDATNAPMESQYYVSHPPN